MTDATFPRTAFDKAGRPQSPAPAATARFRSTATNCCTMTRHVAIAQTSMHWTTAENLGSIERAAVLARSRGAEICAFAELAISGFHRQIAQEALPEVAEPALAAVQVLAAKLEMGIAVGAPTFGVGGIKFNSHVLIDERGQTAAVVCKQGLTDPEATFFARGSSRPCGVLQGLRCTAVICREVFDLDLLRGQFSQGSVDLIFVPGALRQDPEKPRSDPPEYVGQIARLAQATGAFVVHTNWPNALNRPEESVDAGGSTVASPTGEVLFRLPMQQPGVAVFRLGAKSFARYPE